MSSSLPAHQTNELHKLFCKWNHTYIDAMLYQRPLGEKKMKESHIELSTGQKEDYILLLHLSVIRYYWWTDSGLDAEGRLSSMNKSGKSNHRVRQLFWQATIWPKLKPYVTALLFWIVGKIFVVTPFSELTDRLGYFTHLKTQDGEKSFGNRYDLRTLDFIIKECNRNISKYWY